MNLLHFLHMATSKTWKTSPCIPQSTADCIRLFRFIKMVQRLHHKRMFPPPNGNKYPTTAMVRCSPLGLVENVFFDIGFLFLRISIWQKNSSAASIEFWNSQEIGLSNDWQIQTLLRLCGADGNSSVPKHVQLLGYRMMEVVGWSWYWHGAMQSSHMSKRAWLGPLIFVAKVLRYEPMRKPVVVWNCRNSLNGTSERASLSTMPLQEIRRLVQVLQW